MSEGREMDVAAGRSATGADPCVRFQSVSKRYIRRHVDGWLLREIWPGAGARKRGADEFWALRGLDFQIGRGETVGILGENGSGKSTLLSCMAGATLPTEGRVSVRGRVAPILSLGVGFELDMSAIENAYINASLLGVDPEQLSTLLPQVLDFAELGEFVDTPVRHFSSGMVARLGFAVAIAIQRDIVLVDEVLAVGDQAFQRKCLERFRELQGQGVTVIMATHDMSMARALCDRAIWLKDGRIQMDADADECVAAYESAFGPA